MLLCRLCQIWPLNRCLSSILHSAWPFRPPKRRRVKSGCQSPVRAISHTTPNSHIPSTSTSNNRSPTVAMGNHSGITLFVIFACCIRLSYGQSRVVTVDDASPSITYTANPAWSTTNRWNGLTSKDNPKVCKGNWADNCVSESLDASQVYDG